MSEAPPAAEAFTVQGEEDVVSTEVEPVQESQGEAGSQEEDDVVIVISEDEVKCTVLQLLSVFCSFNSFIK